MKIKLWLSITFLILMLLPIAGFSFMIYLVQQFDQKQDIMDYVSVQEKLDYYERLLDTQKLFYSPTKQDFDQLKVLSEQNVHFSLFDENGLLYFSTKPNTDWLIKEKQDSIFQHLYELRPTYYEYQYKKPVFNNNKIIGFYEVQFPRDTWLKGVKFRKNLALITFAILFIVIYSIALYFLNTKLIVPLSKLTKQMNLYAAGHETEKLSTQNDEIGELISHFNDMKKQLTLKQRLIDQEQQHRQFMIAAISHDVKTPLTAIRTSAEMIDHIDAEKSKQTIIHKADFIHELIDDLTMYNLLQTSNYAIDLVEVDCDEFFEMLLSEYDELLDQHERKFTIEAYVSGALAVHPKQMMRVADNLVINAIQHSAKQDHIWVSAFTYDRLPSCLFPVVLAHIHASKKRNGVWFVVQNEGSFVSFEDREKIFEPLFQKDLARTKSGHRGSGLGLTISKMIIEKHNGEIFFLSEQSVGSAVLCFLPLSREGSEK